MNDPEFLDELYATCDSCEDDDWDVLCHVGALLAEDRPHLDLSEALDRACVEGDNVGLVLQLLNDPRVDPTNDESSCLASAVALGRIKIVGLLLLEGKVDPNTGDGMCLDIAIENNHREIAKILLANKRVDPTLNENKALFGAIHDGDTEMVAELLKYDSVRQTVNWSDMIDDAIEAENTVVLQLLRAASGITGL